MNKAAVVLIGAAAIAAALMGPDMIARDIRRKINGLPLRVRCVIAWRVLRAKV